ncbi:LlaJI family restriction endonuclease [Ureaplasma diversum]|uniref:Type II restriction modification system endonuclease n=1 Tax=Ureaplasma diversum NCTC 246 TaxID=1188241 RepID=A0A084EZ45_9BACT|nr:LlaJI family restriction endonuclease [Ureaplasma diversum]KEZ23237.1 Type II restriction modification system endonuclease [Ureaplasma diversum NCTC 246]
MNIKILRELDAFYFKDLLDLFNMDTDQLNETLKTLIYFKILRKLTDPSDNELDELLEINNWKQLNTPNIDDLYVFKYVGIVIVSNTCLIIYPKHIDYYKEDKDNNFVVLKQFISVIKKYKYKEQRININDDGLKNNFNLLSLTLELLNNYNEHGLYINNKEIVEENGDGEILWERTINQKSAYILENNLIYLDLYTSNQINNNDNYFTNLHSCLLTIMTNQIKEVLNILDLKPVHLNNKRIEDFGNKEYIISKLNQELSSQFITYKQDTLMLIKRCIQEITDANISNNISFIGTNNFNLVWEDVCSVVFNNCINKPIKDFEFSYYKNNKESLLLSEIIAKPNWKHIKSNKVHIANKTLKPDIITINNKQLSIYDAKYYKLILNENELKNYPAVNDVIKQYLYQVAYIDFAKENDITITNNAFLMPIDANTVLNIGNVNIDLLVFNENNLKNIDVLLLPCKKMFKRYLNNQLITNIKELDDE